MSSRKTSLALLPLVLLALAGSASAAVVCQSPTALRVRSGSECNAAEVKLPIEVVTITAGDLPEQEGSVKSRSAGVANDAGPSTEKDCVMRVARSCGSAPAE